MGRSPSLGVIGAGIAGCALAAALRRGGWAGWIGLWEAGRGPGGRAATRRSRHDPALAIDHGAPLFNIATAPAPALLAPLRAGGWIEPWSGTCVDLDGEGQLCQPSRDPLVAGELWRGCGGMDRIAHGLLELAEVHAPLERHWGHRVRRLEMRPSSGWRLFDSDGEELAEVDWLVLSSSLLAHPRVRKLLGWADIPLQKVAEAATDKALKAAVAAIGAIPWEARSNLLLMIPAPYAKVWRDLPFRLLTCNREAQERWGLARLVIQPHPDGRCAVVAHSSASLAERALQAYGRESAMAREQGPHRDGQAEAEVIGLLKESLQHLLAPWIPSPSCGEGIGAGEGSLMRWSAAFPKGSGLEGSGSFCPNSRIGFCGDYLAGSGYGRVEGALRSAEALAERLLALTASASAL